MLYLGYVAVDHDDEDEIGKLHDELENYATEHGLTLKEVYVDREVEPSSLDRMGLTELVADAQGLDEPGLLILSWADVSSNPEVQMAIHDVLEPLMTETKSARH
jgi:DNA invertase Pin-like site-specific DNA recombinase